MILLGNLRNKLCWFLESLLEYTLHVHNFNLMAIYCQLKCSQHKRCTNILVVELEFYLEPKENNSKNKKKSKNHRKISLFDMCKESFIFMIKLIAY